MASIYEVYPNELIAKTADKLKEFKEIQAPDWAIFVKTGVSKQRPPVNPEWWYFRAAAILRTVYSKGPVGVNKLRTKFGSKKRRGHKPPHFMKASGNIIRKCLQQLEKAGLIKNIEKGEYKGRVITPKGKSLLDKTAAEIMKANPRPAKEEVKKAPKKEAVPSKEEKKGAVQAEKEKPAEKKAVPVKQEAKPAEKEKPKAEEKKPEIKENPKEE